MEEEKTKVKNFLYTKGYVCKRLREVGFDCKSLPMRYSKDDKRYWSILINLKDGNQNLIVTCLKSGIPEKNGDYVIAGSGFHSYKISTKSIEVLSQALNDLCHPIKEVKFND